MYKEPNWIKHLWERLLFSSVYLFYCFYFLLRILLYSLLSVLVNSLIYQLFLVYIALQLVYVLLSALHKLPLFYLFAYQSFLSLSVLVNSLIHQLSLVYIITLQLVVVPLPLCSSYIPSLLYFCLLSFPVYAF